jgi:hypothetical protein
MQGWPDTRANSIAGIAEYVYITDTQRARKPAHTPPDLVLLAPDAAAPLQQGLVAHVSSGARQVVHQAALARRRRRRLVGARLVVAPLRLSRCGRDVKQIS